MSINTSLRISWRIRGKIIRLCIPKVLVVVSIPGEHLVSYRWIGGAHQKIKILHKDVEDIVIGGTGFEPVTSSVSRKRATTAPTALVTTYMLPAIFEYRNQCGVSLTAFRFQPGTSTITVLHSPLGTHWQPRREFSVSPGASSS